MCEQTYKITYYNKILFAHIQSINTYFQIYCRG